MYTPLSKIESETYIGCWYVSPKTAFDKSVIVITSILEDGTILYVEKTMKVVKIVNSVTENGGTTIPVKYITVDERAKDGKPKKGRLVYNNFCGSNRLIQLWVPKYIPYTQTVPAEIYPVILDGWKPGCETNYGKYGTWDVK